MEPITITLGGRERRLAIDLNSMIAIMELTGGDPITITRSLTDQNLPTVERLKQMRLLLYAGLISTDAEVGALPAPEGLRLVGSWIDGTDTLISAATPLLAAVVAYSAKSTIASNEFEGQLAPYVPSPPAVVKAMVEAGGIHLKVGSTVCDLGCGDGRLLAACAKAQPGVQLIGYELHEERAAAAYKAVQAAGGHASIRRDDIRNFRGDADVVFVYLLPASNEEIWPMLCERCVAGTLIISHDFVFPATPAAAVSVPCEDRIHKVYTYVL